MDEETKDDQQAMPAGGDMNQGGDMGATPAPDAPEGGDDMNKPMGDEDKPAEDAPAA